MATPLVCDGDELVRLKQRVAQLEGERTRDGATGASLADPHAAAVTTEERTPETSGGSNDALSWKISSIEKFVPLTSEQRERLREKYEREATARANGDEAETESLDDILGAENATYYREQVSAAFKRVQNEEVERESVWLSRKLGLTSEQESSMRQLFERIESEIGGTHDTGNAGSNPQDRVRAMIAANRRRSELRNAELSRILSPEQLQAYAQIEAESSASDVEVFHDAGGGVATAVPK
jgi:hypothetical protein